MSFTIYPNSSGDGSYTTDEVRNGWTWLHTDVTCPHCGTVQSVTATHYQGGPCVRCGKLTSGEREEATGV